MTHSGPMQPTDPVADAWRRLLEQWDDDDAHCKFIGLCATMDRLPDAGRLYREVRESDGERRAIAEKQIDRLLAHAMQSLEAHRTEPPKRSPRTLLLIAVLVMLGMIAAASWLAR